MQTSSKPAPGLGAGRRRLRAASCSWLTLQSTLCCHLCPPAPRLPRVAPLSVSGRAHLECALV